MSPVLAELLWRRIEPNLNRSDVLRIRPMCFGNGGTWRPYRLNECMKFGKYQIGQDFKRHIDGPWIPREDESSVYTVLIYLNDDFEGGSTTFHAQPCTEKAASLSSELSPDVSKDGYGFTLLSTGDVKIRPSAGSALIFNHDCLHSGLPVISGSKYVIRTEIMFRRIDTNTLPASVRTDYASDPNYLKALTLYRDSYQQGQQGDVKGFTNSYLEALKLQAAAQSTYGSDRRLLEELQIPTAVYIHLFSFLKASEVGQALCVSKAWHDLASDGSLWKIHYSLRYPKHAKMEQQIMNRFKKKQKLQSQAEQKQDDVAAIPAAAFGMVDPAIQDWKQIFKQRLSLEHNFSAVIFEFGSFASRCGLLHPASTPIYELESVVSLVPGIFDMHIRRMQWERFFCGSAARTHDTDGQFTHNVLRAGNVQHRGLVLELMAACFMKLGVWSSDHPVVIAEPPFGWQTAIKQSLSHELFTIYNVPSLCFVNSALLSLMSQNLSSGIVVNLGKETCWIASFVNQRMFTLYDYSAQTTSSAFAAAVAIGAGEEAAAQGSASIDSDEKILPLLERKEDQIFKMYREMVEVEFIGVQDRLREIGVEPHVTPANPNEASSSSSSSIPSSSSHTFFSNGIDPCFLADKVGTAYRELIEYLHDYPTEVQVSAPNHTFHQVVLVGGGTIDKDDRFKRNFQQRITQINSDYRQTPVPSSSQNGSAVKIPEEPLVVILPPNPCQTVIEGGRIFAGLSIFRQQCMASFDLHTEALEAIEAMEEQIEAEQDEEKREALQKEKEQKKEAAESQNQKRLEFQEAMKFSDSSLVWNEGVVGSSEDSTLPRPSGADFYEWCWSSHYWLEKQLTFSMLEDHFEEAHEMFVEKPPVPGSRSEVRQKMRDAHREKLRKEAQEQEESKKNKNAESENGDDADSESLVSPNFGVRPKKQNALSDAARVWFQKIQSLRDPSKRDQLIAKMKDEGWLDDRGNIIPDPDREPPVLNLFGDDFVAPTSIIDDFTLPSIYEQYLKMKLFSSHDAFDVDFDVYQLNRFLVYKYGDEYEHRSKRTRSDLLNGFRNETEGEFDSCDTPTSKFEGDDPQDDLELTLQELEDLNHPAKQQVDEEYEEENSQEAYQEENPDEEVQPKEDILQEDEAEQAAEAQEVSTHVQTESATDDIADEAKSSAAVSSSTTDDLAIDESLPSGEEFVANIRTRFRILAKSY